LSVLWVAYATHSTFKPKGEVGFSVNPEKTDLIVFTRTTKLPGFFEPNTFGVTLFYSESAK
jgi:hypothetical protein